MMDDLVKNFRKKFGEGSMSPITGTRYVGRADQFIPTGCFAYDFATKTFGLPFGRVIEIYGYQSTGKSSLLASAFGMCQGLGGLTILADAEHSYTDDWISLFGINPDKLLVIQPASVQEFGDQLIYILNQVDPSKPTLIGLDSFAALPVEEEIDSDLSDKAQAKHARLASKIFRQVTNLLFARRAVFVIVNQQKDNPSPFGSGVSKAGGHAIDLHASVQVQLRRVSVSTKDPTNITIGIKCTKNKIAAPFGEATTTYYFDYGFDDFDVIMHAADQLGVLNSKGGGWFEFDGNKYRTTDVDSGLFSKITQQVYSKWYGEELGSFVFTSQSLRPIVKLYKNYLGKSGSS